jgi:hypothetical protein
MEMTGKDRFLGAGSGRSGFLFHTNLKQVKYPNADV